MTLDLFEEWTCGSRATLKEFFLRTPRLQSLEISRACIEPFLQGVLDAGVVALSQLRNVLLHLSYLYVPDVDSSLLRRLLHRFPQVTVTIGIDDAVLYADLKPRFGRWSRVEIEERFGMEPPPRPHASDDDDSEVGEFSETENDAANA